VTNDVSRWLHTNLKAYLIGYTPKFYTSSVLMLLYICPHPSFGSPHTNIYARASGSNASVLASVSNLPPQSNASVLASVSKFLP
jgi:hypothetical protein